MNGQNTLRVGILVGPGPHPQAVIDDLWHRAGAAVDPHSWRLAGIAVYVHDGGPALAPAPDGLSVAALDVPCGGPAARLASVLAGRPGPAGAAGRLLRDNLASRRLARALARRNDLLQEFCGSAVVVAADLAADRAVWQLRRRTDAALVHGPVAMLHALRQQAGLG